MKKMILFVFTALLFGLRLTAQHWIPQGQGLLPYGYEVNSISVVGEDVIWVAASLNKAPFYPPKIFRSVDGGLHWEGTDFEACENCDCHRVEAIDANIAWLTIRPNIGPAQLYKTEDGGQHWELKLAGASAGNGIQLYGNQRLGVRNGASYGWSVDDGESWTIRLMTDLPTGFYSHSAAGSVTGDLAWFGMEGDQWYTYHPKNALLIRSANYGQEYSFAETGLDSVAVIDFITFSDSLHGIMKYIRWVPTLDWELFPAFTWSDHHQLAITEDGGSSWSTLPSPIDNIKGLATITGLPEVVFVQGEKQLAWTSDRGETWVSEDLDQNICCMDFTNAHTGWVAVNGTSSNHPLVYKWNGDFSSATEAGPSSPDPIQVDPNPVHDIALLNVEPEMFSPLVITLRDMTGRTVFNQKTNSPQINISHLPAGVYILSVEQKGRNRLAKILKQ